MDKKPAYEEIDHGIKDTEKETGLYKELEKVMEETEEEWLSLVQNAPDIILKVDREGKIRYINHTVQGFTVEKTIGTSVYEYIPPEYEDKTRESIEHVFKTGDVVRFETKAAGPKGTTSWYSTRLGPIRRNNKIVAVTQISTDITEIKQAEDVLRSREQELENKTTNLEEVNTALKILLKKREEDKIEIEEKVLLNVKELVEPYLEKLKKAS